jgi:hypothetical protein
LSSYYISNGGEHHLLKIDYISNWTSKGGWQFMDGTIHFVPAHLFMNTYLEIASEFENVIPWSGMLIKSSGFRVLTWLSRWH